MKKAFQITLLLIILSYQSVACRCHEITNLKQVQLEALNNFELIFVGRIIENNENKTLYKLRVVELLKGSIQDSTIVGKWWSSCSVSPGNEGNLWLIYANYYRNEIINIELCGLSRSFKNPLLNIKNDEPKFPKNEIRSGTQTYLEVEKIMTNRKLEHLRILEKEIEDLRRTGG